MLLFIRLYTLNASEPSRFNTSHVTLYRRSYTRVHCDARVSIHLMLLFIGLLQKKSALLLGFNTSHVTLYRHSIQNISR